MTTTLERPVRTHTDADSHLWLPLTLPEMGTAPHLAWERDLPSLLMVAPCGCRHTTAPTDREGMGRWWSKHKGGCVFCRTYQRAFEMLHPGEAGGAYTFELHRLHPVIRVTNPEGREYLIALNGGGPVGDHWRCSCPHGSHQPKAGDKHVLIAFFLAMLNAQVTCSRHH